MAETVPPPATPVGSTVHALAWIALLRRELAAFRWRRWIPAGAGTYFIALAATLPASVAADWAGMESRAESWSGTVWNGAALMQGGHDLRWQTAPLRSLMRFGLALDATLTGPETDIETDVVLRPGLIQLRDMSGRTGWSLVRLFGVDTALTCDLSLRLDLTYLAFGEDEADASGRFSSGGGGCTGPNAPATIPPLTGAARSDEAGAHLEVATREQPGTTLMAAHFAPDGNLRLAITQEGAAALPGVRGATSLEIAQ